MGIKNIMMGYIDKFPYIRIKYYKTIKRMLKILDSQENKNNLLLAVNSNFKNKVRAPELYKIRPTKDIIYSKWLHNRGFTFIRYHTCINPILEIYKEMFELIDRCKLDPTEVNESISLTLLITLNLYLFVYNGGEIEKDYENRISKLLDNLIEVRNRVSLSAIESLGAKTYMVEEALINEYDKVINKINSNKKSSKESLEVINKD